MIFDTVEGKCMISVYVQNISKSKIWGLQSLRPFMCKDIWGFLNGALKGSRWKF